MEHATPPIPRHGPRPGSADWLLEREYVEHRDEVIRSVRKQLYGRGAALDASDLEAAYNGAWHVLHQKLSAGERVANRQGLLVVIMVRRILSERRTLAGSNPPVPLDSLAGPILADHAADPVQQVSDRERIRQLLEGLRERLSRRELQAATLCYLHGYTRPDAARLLDIPPKRMEKMMDRVSREISGVVQDVERGWCHANRSMITAYALGVLASPGQRHGLAQEHLAHCASCRRRVLVMRGMAVLSPPAPLLGTGGGAAVVAGAVGGGAAVTVGVGTPIGVGLAGALSGAAAVVGTVVVLGTGVVGSTEPSPVAASGPPASSLGATLLGATASGPMIVPAGRDAPSPAAGVPVPRPTAVIPRHGAPASGDPAHGPAGGGSPGPVTPVPPAPGVSALGSRGTAEAAPAREERSSRTDGASATGSASGATTGVGTDADVADDGRRRAHAEATASGPSAQAGAVATAEAPDSTVDSLALATGESTSTVDVGSHASAEAGGADPSSASATSDAWAIGGAADATLATTTTTTVLGAAPATAEAAARVSGPSATSSSSSEILAEEDEGTASGTAAARSGEARSSAAPVSYEIPVPDDLVAGFRWSASMAFLDAVTQQQVQLDLSWLLVGLPSPGATLSFATVGGSGTDGHSVAVAYGAGVVTVATRTLDGGTAGAAATAGDGHGWSVALAVVDGARSFATGVARGEGDGGSREALVDTLATANGSASAIAGLVTDDAGAGKAAAPQSVEATALAQIGRLLRPMRPAPPTERRGTATPTVESPDVGGAADVAAPSSGTAPEAPASDPASDDRVPPADDRSDPVAEAASTVPEPAVGDEASPQAAADGSQGGTVPVAAPSPGDAERDPDLDGPSAATQTDPTR